MNKLIKYIIILVLFFKLDVYANTFSLLIENDTLNKQYFDSLSYKTYISPGGGFVSGNNAYFDQVKAQEFHAGNLCNIYAVFFQFGHKSFSSLSDSSYVGINFYHINNTGRSTLTSTAPCPGDIFFRDSIKVLDIDIANGNMLTYASPLFTDSNFAIGIDLNKLTATDTIALFTNKDGDAGTREQSWEKDQSGNWFTLKYNWPLNVDFAIFPIVNTAVGLNLLIPKSKLVEFYPNPSTDGIVTLNLPKAMIKNIQVYNGNLQSISNELNNLGQYSSQLKIKSEAKGIYYIKIVTDNGITMQKLFIQ